MKALLIYIGVVTVAAVAFLPLPANGGVRVEDDEVVFTIEAPGASRVFLVGEFNNWNPTLERMEREGDFFVLRLYLLAGVHRYKFVVDGEWQVDPDNVPRDPQRGSLLVLEERAGMLVLGSEEDVVAEVEVKLEPTVRYTGGFFTEDGNGSSKQTLDFYFGYEGKKVRANADLKTTNESWHVDPLRARVWLNNGFAEFKLGNTILEAFENDTIWASADPFHMVGDVGVFDYNVARQRKGVSFESHEILKTRIRAIYADKIDEQLFAPVTIPAAAFGGFAGSASSDTTVYRYNPGLADQDMWAFELHADFGSFGFGYDNRRNRGLHPGLLADVSRVGSAFGVTASNTREYWAADVLWLRWAVLDRMSIRGGYGWSSADVRQTTRSTSLDSTLGTVGIGQDASTSDGEVPLQSDTRWDGALEFGMNGWNATLGYQWNEFDFDPFVGDASRSKIQTVSLDIEYATQMWNAGAAIRYVDQDYGSTPVDFHFFTPLRNFWLDWGDALDVPGQVQFDMRRATHVAATFGWDRHGYDPNRRLGAVVPFGILVTLDGVAADFLDSFEYAALRVDGEYGITRNVYFDMHARLARYDKESWQAKETYFDSYLEVGYRNKHVELNVGIGADPVVIDPVPNEFLLNGWEQTLRRGIPADVTRDQALTLGHGLQAQERALESDHTLKLELIVFF